ncbi:hypothetical protein Tco_0122113 [Tanacetum coccineum]
MGPRINKIFAMSRVTSKGSALELVKRETDARVMSTLDALKHSETLCAITMLENGENDLANSSDVKGKRRCDAEIPVSKRV